MTLLNDADGIYFRSTMLNAVYNGPNLVWGNKVPRSITNLLLWWCTQDSTYTNGQKVDGSFRGRRNGEIMGTSTVDFQPTYVTNGINGLPSFYYDGVNDVSATFNYTFTSSFSFFVVMKLDTFANRFSSPLWYFGGGYPSGLYIDPAGKVRFYAYSTTSQADEDIVTSSGSITANVPFIAGANKINDTMEVYLNNAKNSLTTGKTYQASTTGNFSIGGNGNYMQGLISEILVFDRALTSSEVLKVNNYLSIKYAIPIVA